MCLRVGELGFVHHRLDVAFLIWYHPDNTVGIMMIVHVDDVMLSHDESSATAKIVDKFHKRFQFSEWTKVADAPGGVDYTGRTIKVLNKEEVLVNQAAFVRGRMDPLKITRGSNRADEDPCTEVETAEFRSGGS